MKQLGWIFLILSVSQSVYSAPKNSKKPSKATKPTAVAEAKKPEVLDFEADLIEGQKKVPELFLQLNIETEDLNAILYDRKNFNDFHVWDKARRPMLSRQPKKK